METELERVDAAGDWVEVHCPSCFERVEILIEPDLEGTLVQDCEVCCRPWQLTVRHRRGGSPEVQVEPA